MLFLLVGIKSGYLWLYICCQTHRLLLDSFVVVLVRRYVYDGSPLFSLGFSRYEWGFFFASGRMWVCCVYMCGLGLVVLLGGGGGG